jgi:hypothetical protein
VQGLEQPGRLVSSILTRLRKKFKQLVLNKNLNQLKILLAIQKSKRLYLLSLDSMDYSWAELTIEILNTEVYRKREK